MLSRNEPRELLVEPKRQPTQAAPPLVCTVADLTAPYGAVNGMAKKLQLGRLLYVLEAVPPVHPRHVRSFLPKQPSHRSHLLALSFYLVTELCSTRNNMEPTKADHQEPKRLTMRQVVAQLVLVVPKRSRKPGMDADPLIERLNTALLNLWSRPFYAFIESHRRTLSFKRASARFEDALHRLLSDFFKIRSADMTLGDKLRQLAQLLVRLHQSALFRLPQQTSFKPDLDFLDRKKPTSSPWPHTLHVSMYTL